MIKDRIIFCGSIFITGRKPFSVFPAKANAALGMNRISIKYIVSQIYCFFNMFYRILKFLLRFSATGKAIDI